MLKTPNSPPILYNTTSLTWHVVFTPTYLKLIALFIVLLMLLVPVLLSIDYLQNSPNSGDLLSQHHLNSIKKKATHKINPHNQLLIPNPFPFPPLRSHRMVYQRKRFSIPDAEFNIEVAILPQWKKTLLKGTIIRFHNQNILDGELTFSAECFGRCDQMEKNIQQGLMNALKEFFHQGRIARVVHWHVHHKTWVEFSLLYKDTNGQFWLHGMSLRASKDEWIHGLKCDYRAPIDFSVENEEVLHFAWDEWVPTFIRMCRDYKVSVRDY